MNFYESLKLLQEGKKVRRTEWETWVWIKYDEERKNFISPDMYNPCNLFHNSVLHGYDIFSDDWEIYNP